MSSRNPNPFLNDPRFMQYVDCIFHIRGKKNRFCLPGVGSNWGKTNIKVADFARRAAIKRWVRNIFLINGPAAVMIIDWDIPGNQNIVEMHFATRYTITNVQKSLGVSNHILLVDDLEM
jgi:hypothetical protein